MKNLIKPFIISTMMLLAANVAFAGIPTGPLPLKESLTNTGTGAGFDVNKDIPTVVGTIIKWILALVGIIALVFFIAGGFQYLTSAGNEEQTTAAKNRMIYAVVGLIIIAIAWVATAYVVGLFEATRGPAVPTG